MLRVCQERAQQRPAKRRLVSLFEANEVAKRLAAAGRSTGRGRNGGSENDNESSGSNDDPEGWGKMNSHW